MSLWLTELVSLSSYEIATSLQDLAITVPKSVAVLPQQTRSPVFRVLDYSPVILFFGAISFHGSRSDRDALHLDDRDNPALERAGTIFFTEQTIPVLGDPTTSTTPYTPPYWA